MLNKPTDSELLEVLGFNEGQKRTWILLAEYAMQPLPDLIKDILLNDLESTTDNPEHVGEWFVKKLRLDLGFDSGEAEKQ